MTIIDLENVKIYSVNSLHLIFKKVDGYFEEINGNRYLKLVPTKESKEKIKLYEEICSKIRDLINSVKEEEK